MSLYKPHYPFLNLFLQTQTPVFQHWSERRNKAELSSAFTDFFPLPLRVIHREKILKFLLYLSPSRIDIFGCADRTLSKLTTCGIKKHTQNYLKLGAPKRISTTHTTYPEILTGAPNKESGEDKLLTN